MHTQTPTHKRHTDTETDTQTHSHRHTVTNTHRHTDTHRDRDTHRHRHTHTETHTQIHTQTHTHRHTVTNTHRHRHTETETHRYTHTDTHRHRYTQTHSHIETHTQTHTDTHTHTHALFRLSRSRCRHHSLRRCVQSPLLLICQVLVLAPLGGSQNVPGMSRYPNPRSSAVVSRHSSSSLPPLPLFSQSSPPGRGRQGVTTGLRPAGRAPRCPSPRRAHCHGDCSDYLLSEMPYPSHFDIISVHSNCRNQ